ncbi:redox-sensitive transcriptional activator SoxR [Pseudomonas sp. D1-3]|uniref:redox-sensitive transcriptional activator SoxR n=1 Tax=Phytopseudomonas argentinensis TaxID=289370 RepID=UPI00147D650E|nr:redox-sensitive transcriptional activator SoxR [Pseudomonas argentinensis]
MNNWIGAHRSAGNQRRYPKDVSRRIAIIKIAQQTGMSMTEVGECFAALPASRTPTAADWRALSQHWQSELNDRIESLLVPRNKLDSCIDCGLSLNDCPLRA